LDIESGDQALLCRVPKLAPGTSCHRQARPIRAQSRKKQRLLVECQPRNDRVGGDLSDFDDVVFAAQIKAAIAGKTASPFEAVQLGPIFGIPDAVGSIDAVSGDQPVTVVELDAINPAGIGECDELPPLADIPELGGP